MFGYENHRSSRRSRWSIVTVGVPWMLGVGLLVAAERAGSDGWLTRGLLNLWSSAPLNDCLSSPTLADAGQDVWHRAPRPLPASSSGGPGPRPLPEMMVAAATTWRPQAGPEPEYQIDVQTAGNERDGAFHLPAMAAVEGWPTAVVDLSDLREDLKVIETRAAEFEAVARDAAREAKLRQELGQALAADTSFRERRELQRITNRFVRSAAKASEEASQVFVFEGNCSDPAGAAVEPFSWTQ